MTLTLPLLSVVMAAMATLGPQNVPIHHVPKRWIPRSEVAPDSVPVRPMSLTSTGQTTPALRSRNCLAPSRQLKSINSGRGFRTLVQFKWYVRDLVVKRPRRCLGRRLGGEDAPRSRRARHHSLWEWRVGCLRSDWTSRLRARRDVAALVVSPITP